VLLPFEELAEEMMSPLDVEVDAFPLDEDEADEPTLPVEEARGSPPEAVWRSPLLPPEPDGTSPLDPPLAEEVEPPAELVFAAMTTPLLPPELPLPPPPNPPPP
jgi:hypothetical protein